LLNKAAELDPAQPRYAYVFAMTLGAAGQSAESPRVLEAALKTSPSDFAIIALLCQNVLTNGEASHSPIG
jgi:predicted Zn-dependent protease